MIRHDEVNSLNVNSLRILNAIICSENVYIYVAVTQINAVDEHLIYLHNALLNLNDTCYMLREKRLTRVKIPVTFQKDIHGQGELKVFPQWNRE